MDKQTNTSRQVHEKYDLLKCSLNVTINTRQTYLIYVQKVLILTPIIDLMTIELSITAWVGRVPKCIALQTYFQRVQALNSSYLNTYLKLANGRVAQQNSKINRVSGCTETFPFTLFDIVVQFNLI